MALAIDSTYLAQKLMPYIQRRVDDYYARQSGRWEVNRVCAHATVIHDAPTIQRFTDLLAKDIDLVNREALDWQADRDDDLDEMEVLHHLKHQAKTSPLLELAFSQTNASSVSTTLVTSVAKQSPSLAASAQGKPPSCFHRCSLRFSYVVVCDRPSLQSWSKPRNNIPHTPGRHWFCWFPPGLKVVGARFTGYKSAVVWQVQADFVDLLRRRSIPISRPGKRRRTTPNPLHRVSSPLVQDLSQRDRIRDAKRFKGVRYRPERRAWAAETKASKHKNKLWFGEFKSPTEAARAIDAAFHYYDKPHLLNFPDTPWILSTRPPPPGVQSKEDKLRFVKEQGRWLASMASTLPSSPPWIPPAIPGTSSRACSADPLGFCSFSEIASFLSCGDGDADEADDGISQFQASLHPDARAELLGNGLLECNSVCADAVGFLDGTLEERQGLLEWNFENFADPSLSTRWSSNSSVHITDGWDGAEHSSTPAVCNLENSAQPSDCESQGSWLNSLLMSPPAPTIAKSCIKLTGISPSHNQFASPLALLEAQSVGGEWLSR